ncbi:MAG: NAD-dependent epimerase/dehydratase family protein [Deltaproteobacteria bacterium]|nr:MAG: NAD-dependent epimerase/dehydratase family protein [Deltaproteobacteria bacterium]
MRCTITGATGLLGRALCRRLLDAGHEVTALVRDEGRARSRVPDGVRFVVGDVRDRAAVESAVDGAEAVFHAAAWYKVGLGRAARPEAEATNVDGTRNVLEAACAAGARRIVYTSTVAIYGDTKGRFVTEDDEPVSPPATIYEETKRRAHYEVFVPLARAGAPVVALLPGVIYGPGDEGPVADALRMWLAGKLPTLPGGTMFCWSHVDDVAAAHVAAVDRAEDGAAYIVTGPAHTLVDAFRLAADTLGRPMPKVVLPPAILRVTAALLSPLSGRLPPAFDPESLRSTAGTTYLGRNDRARRSLGFDPRPLEEGFPPYVRDLAAETSG